MDPTDDSGPPSAPTPIPNNGGIMVFYPCAPDDLTSDPRANELIVRAISRAGARLTRDSPLAPSGFALMVPNDAFADHSRYREPVGDILEGEEAEPSSARRLADDLWPASESKQTQWSPRGGFASDDDESPDRFDAHPASSSSSRQTTQERGTITTPPPLLCDKFTSCSPTPSTTSTYPDSGVGDPKSASCQDLVLESGVDAATSSTMASTAAASLRNVRLSSGGDTIPSSEEDRWSGPADEHQDPDEGEDPFDTFNQILGASLVRPLPVYPFVQTRDQATATDEAVFGAMERDEENGDDDALCRMIAPPSPARITMASSREELSSMLVETGSRLSLDEDFHSPVDSDGKEEEEDEGQELSIRDDDVFACKDAKTDTEDLSWMISIAVGTPDKDSDDFAGETSSDYQQLTASPPLPFRKAASFLGPSSSAVDAQVQTASSLFAVSRSSQVSPERVTWLTTLDSTVTPTDDDPLEDAALRSEVRLVLEEILESVVVCEAKEEARFPKMWLLDKECNTEDVATDETDFGGGEGGEGGEGGGGGGGGDQGGVKSRPVLSRTEIETFVFAPLKRKSRKCQASVTTADSFSMTDYGSSPLSVCPQRSADFPPVEKSDKKSMTERWVVTQCDASCAASPWELAPLGMSPVFREEYLPPEAAEVGVEGGGDVSLAEPSPHVPPSPPGEDTFHSFLTASYSTLPDDVADRDADLDRDVVGSDEHRLLPSDSGHRSATFIRERRDKSVDATVETKDASVHMKKHEVRSAATNTEAVASEREAELEGRLRESEAALAGEVDLLEGKVVELEASLAKKVDYIPPLEGRLRALEASSAEKDDCISLLEGRLKESEASLAERADHILLLEDRLKELEASLIEKSDYIPLLEGGVKDLETSLAEKDDYIPLLEAELKELKAALAEKGEYIPLLEAELKELKAALAEKDDYIPLLEAELKESKAALAEKGDYIPLLEERLKELEATSVVKDDRIARLTADARSAEERLATVSEENNNGVILAAATTDELVDLAVEKHELPRWTAEKIVADLLTTAVMVGKESEEERKGRHSKTSRPEMIEAAVGTVKVKTKNRKTNTEVTEAVEVGCDPIEPPAVTTDTGCDPIDLSSPTVETSCDTIDLPASTVDAGCDPVDLSAPTVEIGCDVFEAGTADASTQIFVAVVDKYTHMALHVQKSVAVATEEVELVEASTSTGVIIADSATQAGVTVKDKGTSPHKRPTKTKSKETMTDETEMVERWTSMSSLIQVKDKAVFATLKNPVSDAETETEKVPDMKDAESNAVPDFQDAKIETEKAAPEVKDAAVNAVRDSKEAQTETSNGTREADVDATPDVRDAAVDATREVKEAQTETSPETTDVDVDATPGVQDAAVDVTREHLQQESATFHPGEGLLSSTRDEDIADILGVDDGSSFHTCHQHSPTLLDDDGDDEAPQLHSLISYAAELSSAAAPLSGDLLRQWHPQGTLQQKELLFSPSPIAIVESQDVATDMSEFDEYLVALDVSIGPTPQALGEDEPGVAKTTTAATAASPFKTSELVKRLMAPTVASSSKRRSPQPKRKGVKGKRGVDSPHIVKGIKPSDGPRHFQSGSSSSPEDGSPEFHAGFRTVMKELKKRMSDVQLPVETVETGDGAQDGEVEEDVVVVVEDQRLHQQGPMEASRRRFRLPGVSPAIASSTPTKIPTPKALVHSVVRRRRSPEFDFVAATASSSSSAASSATWTKRTSPDDRGSEFTDIAASTSAPSRRSNVVGVVRPSRSMETVLEHTISPQTVLGRERLSRAWPDAQLSKSQLQQQIEEEIDRRESRRHPSSAGGVSTEETNLDLRFLRGEEVAASGGGVVESVDSAAVTESPAGSDDDRRLSSRSRECKDLEWENEWELAQQSPQPGRLIATSSLDALTADLGFSVHSFHDSNAELDASRFEYLENEIDSLKDAISRRDATLREYRTELEERDLHVDHCNQVLHETQAHYAKLAEENSALKAEVDKLERVMLMQDDQIVALNMDKNHLQHEIEYKDSEHEEVYKFLDDEKRILEEEKKSLEQDKRDMEGALLTAQEELKAISDNTNFDEQRLINVLEGAGSELDNLGEQVAAEQVVKQQLASENRTLKDLLDQARRHSLESIGKIESMEKVLRDRKECRMGQERTGHSDQPDVEDATYAAPAALSSAQEESALKILSEIVSVAAELKAEMLKTPTSCPNSPIYPSKGSSGGRKSVPHSDSGDAEGFSIPEPVPSRVGGRPSLLQELSTLHDYLYELKSLLLVYKKEAQDAIGDLVSSNIQLIDEQYAQGNTMAKRVEMEKAGEIETLKKDLKESRKQVKLGKSQIETFTRSMKKQNERIKDLEDQNRAFELQIALTRDEGRGESHAFVSFPREDSMVDDSSLQESKRLKKEYWRLISKQISDKEHYDRLFGKLTRRMQVLEDNWRKADDEVVMLDELVQHIRFTLIGHINVVKGCDSLFALLQELNAVVEAAGGDVNSSQRMEIGAASSPGDTVSTPPTSQSS